MNDGQDHKLASACNVCASTCEHLHECVDIRACVYVCVRSSLRSFDCACVHARAAGGKEADARMGAGAAARGHVA
eukprot:6178721-Pleurochrysis_carterae.AAC.4